jgi:hypothetical protein
MKLTPFRTARKNGTTQELDKFTASNKYIDLGNFNSSDAGVVKIFDDSLGTMGEALGSSDTNAGANVDVRVDLDA